MNILGKIRNFIRRGHGDAKHRDGERLDSLTRRCDCFRRLLSANHAALDVMSDMGDALSGLRPVDMNYVRSGCVSAVASVGRMVKALRSMAPEQYDALSPQLRAIAERIDALIHVKADTIEHGPMILPLRDVAHRPDLAGPKTATLMQAGEELDLYVPDGFVFTPDAFREFMDHGLRDEIERLSMTAEADDLAGLYTLSSRIAQKVQATPLPPKLHRQLRDMLESRPPGRYAVRSSALNEDKAGTSFAGQYRSVLNVGPEGVADAYREVVASAFSATAMSYRRNLGQRDDQTVMCVACMEMIDAEVGGVMYTRDPLAREPSLLQVHAVPGLPASIVDGTCTPDTWSVDTGTMTVAHSHAADKRSMRRCMNGEGTCVELLRPEHGRKPCLRTRTVLLLARTGVRLEQHFKSPQDVEWAVTDDKIVILQCRPLEIRTQDRTGEQEVSTGAVIQGGTTASPGAAAGPPHVVRGKVDLLDMPEGAVLLTDQAHPEWAVVLSKTAAIVAEHGSTAGHLANVAREFNVPALFGAPDAVNKLKEYSSVTVDASRCAVYPGTRAHLLAPASDTPPLMAKSPVMRCLRAAMNHIIPLNLTDAASPEFSPAHCETLHDITRFCHEMGVSEMVNATHGLPGNAARRLVTDVPTRYWVIDMGGGMDPSRGRTVTLDQIRSKPMLALWQGMTAKPWQGPPPPTPGGFLSVIMEASATPGLAPGAANDMGGRNFLLIGSHYCNLQSRYGFHFSTVEGHAGPFPDENYAYLQFKGGGASPDRRKMRAEMVRGILSRKGFLATAKGDAVFARMENESAQRILNGLKVLGHIVMHTRQLDMDMNAPQDAQRHEQRLLSEIRDILASPAPGPDHASGQREQIP
ncbi:PEP/pyruvate-binding domain-containing protein [Pseudodesulfovibrio senegalensis]|nr:PEP/pyruvate-binding domain-containing protein [Pseudodesulfovibrio senegalensis]